MEQKSSAEYPEPASVPDSSTAERLPDQAPVGRLTSGGECLPNSKRKGESE